MRIKKPTVIQQATEYMQGKIADGSWRVGEMIPSENMLIEELGISRVSIRLALRQFVALGVMRSVHGKGTFLVRNSVNPLEQNSNNISPDDCRDIAKVLEYRMIVEPESCFLAAERITPDIIVLLRRHVEDQKNSVGDFESFFENDWAFHADVVRASQNPLLEKSLLTVFEHAKGAFRRIIEIYKFKGRGIYYHSLIIDALEKRDSRSARALMREHLETVHQQVAAVHNLITNNAESPPTDHRP